ncbi:hypothetical protein H0H81_008921 [Sphagnurus paluster]|uniref:Uncharacterized protein n=1 Tax=Sphagnurus paluster TaxID=117069 RepID=A0A9P7FSE6_9AGAR|nr:hypothetical protein H0H81_008921 [Sphagnurus paluster]
MMRSIDIRSESAVKLLSEFLDMDAPYVEGGRHVNAEHFAHEVYSFVRSPIRDLFVYDTVVQYDVVPEFAPSRPPFGERRSHRDLIESMAKPDERDIRSPTPYRSGTSKGKERIDPGTATCSVEGDVSQSRPSASNDASEIAFVAQGGVIDHTRVPRNRSLLESVHAHLNSGNKTCPKKSDKGKTPTNATERQIDSATPPIWHEPQPVGLSLLARVKIPQVLVCGPESKEGLSSSQSIENLREQLPSNDRRPSTWSAPEIMSRTRARLAQQHANSIATSFQSEAIDSSLTSAVPSPIQDASRVLTKAPQANVRSLTGFPEIATHTGSHSDTVRQPRVSSTLRDLQHHPSQGTRNLEDVRDAAVISALHDNEYSHPSLGAEVRTSLVARLEREKLNAHALSLPVLDNQRILQALQPSSKQPNHKMDTIENAADPHLLEAKLRTRTQLKFRLAAEKRKSGV